MALQTPTIPSKADKRIDVSEARKTFADLVSQVGFGKDRFILCRNGKEIAALIPMADLKFFEHLENEYDLAAVREVLKNPKWLTAKEARKKLGLE